MFTQEKRKTANAARIAQATHLKVLKDSVSNQDKHDTQNVIHFVYQSVLYMQNLGRFICHHIKKLHNHSDTVTLPLERMG